MSASFLTKFRESFANKSWYRYFPLKILWVNLVVFSSSISMSPHPKNHTNKTISTEGQFDDRMKNISVSKFNLPVIFSLHHYCFVSFASTHHKNAWNHECLLPSFDEDDNRWHGVSPWILNDQVWPKITAESSSQKQQEACNWWQLSG